MTLLAPCRAVRPDESPAYVYLATLARTGRRAQSSALASIARILCHDGTVATTPWHLLRYQHVAAVREFLVEQDYAPATVNRWLAALRGVLRQGWLLGLLTADEYHRAREVPPARGRRLPAGRAPEPAEIRRLLDAAGPRERATIALLYGAGLRVGEAAALEVGHLDLGHATVRLVGKGNAEREVPLAPFVVRALEDWYRVRGAWNGPLLSREDGRPMHPNTVASALERVAARAGVTDVTPHDLRRAFVTHLLERGHDLANVQALAGHADPRTTSRYDRRSTEDRRRAVADLDP